MLNTAEVTLALAKLQDAVLVKESARQEADRLQGEWIDADYRYSQATEAEDEARRAYAEAVVRTIKPVRANPNLRVSPAR